MADWLIGRFREQCRTLHDLRWEATRLRERPVLLSMLLVLLANVLVFAAMDGVINLDRLVTFASAAISTSMIAFGGLSWALDGAATPAATVLRLRAAMAPTSALDAGRESAAGKAASAIAFSGVGFAYPTTPGVTVLGRTVRAKPRLPSSCAGSMTRWLARYLLTVHRLARWTLPHGASRSRQCFRTTFASSCLCETTLRRGARRKRSFVKR